MRRNPIETVLGGVVLLIAGMFLVFAYSTARVSTAQGYPLSATFLKVGGLEIGSDVRVSGIRVGTVTAQELDLDTFEARVTLNIDPSVQLPEDTVATIVSDGLLGGKYVDLQPGQAGATLGAGGEITMTRDFQALEDLVGEIIFLATGGDSSSP